jgi:tetratricopeptide (TPR) repeat protein
VKKATWAAFPYPHKRFQYAGSALKKHWDRLHLGDKEPYPSAQHLAKLCKENRQAEESIPHFDQDFGPVSEKLLDAWRFYHQGEFQSAAEQGVSLGAIGYAVANKAAAIHATYLEKGGAVKQKRLQEVVARAEQAIAVLPRHANSHYLYAYALGRYSQEISVVQALAQGFGGKVKSALERTLELEPEHAEAHTAMGTYHAEILDKVGALLGALTYGASKDDAVRHYQTALKLHPQSAIARVEFANALMMIYGKSRLEEATRLYVEASNLEACDAMEQLDIELAKSQLEEAP